MTVPINMGPSCERLGHRHDWPVDIREMTVFCLTQLKHLGPNDRQDCPNAEKLRGIVASENPANGSTEGLRDQ